MRRIDQLGHGPRLFFLQTLQIPVKKINIHLSICQLLFPSDYFDLVRKTLVLPG
jgi:hypothetical protein